MRNQKGITLIALVITIIVLLILAGVSIAMLTGKNGILTQANNAKAETTKAEAIEKINMSLNAVKSKIYEEQVSNSTWKPASGTDDVQTDIVNIMKEDLGTDLTKNAATAEGKYTYNVAGGKLSVSYINSSAGVKTAVTGSITLTSPYTIDKAK